MTYYVWISSQVVSAGSVLVVCIVNNAKGHIFFLVNIGAMAFIFIKLLTVTTVWSYLEEKHAEELNRRNLAAAAAAAKKNDCAKYALPYIFFGDEDETPFGIVGLVESSDSL